MPNACSSKSRIGILMLNSPNIDRYAHYATLVNYMYAAKHGYGFLVTRCPDARDIGKDWAWDYNYEYLFVWSKARMLAHALRLFDIVLFIDSDAMVWDFETTIESKVAKLMGPKTCLVMAEDCMNSTMCFNVDKVNAGVILARRSPKTFEILEHWMQPDRDCAAWKYTHPREQECVDILRKKHYKDFIRKVGVQEMNGWDGTWIRHFMTMSANYRETVIRQHLDRVLGIPTTWPSWWPWWPGWLALVVVGVALVTMVLTRRFTRK